MPMHLDDLILAMSSIVGAFAFSGFYWMIYKIKKCEDQPSEKNKYQYWTEFFFTL